MKKKNSSRPTLSAQDFLPAKHTLPALRAAAEHCKGCHLYKYATQTVFGSGSSKSPLMVVGEIPGDKEDQTGIPFTGPAGVYLRKTLVASGLDPEDIYFTNVVKHFKFIKVNNRRMHRSPVSSEVRACFPWLETEIAVIQPKIILCLGATAARALVANHVHLKEQRGKWYPYSESIRILITFHPAAILRAPDESRKQMKNFFVKDLKKVAIFLTKK